MQAQALNPELQSSDIYIGRQPIFDRNNHLFAYELLYRNGCGNYANPASQETATAEVLVNGFLEIGLDKLVAGHPAFINLPRGLLLGNEIHGLPRDKVVLEVLEDIEADADVCHALERLRQAGYRIALDDFILSDSNQALLVYADIVKVDIRALLSPQLQRQVARLKSLPLKLLAEKVETRSEYQACLDLGFDYFQGYYFCKPEIVKGSKLGSNRLAVLQLLTRLYDPSVSLGQIEQIIKHDVSLSFKLLRVCNSAAFGDHKKIDSIAQAVALLGLDRVRQWVAFIVFSGFVDKPLEISRISLLRAYMCASLARELNLPDREKAFTVGMFSVLDALFDQAMPELLANMSLVDDVNQALLQRQGILGDILASVIAYQSGEWDDSKISVTSRQLRRHFLDAMVWADDMCASLKR